MLSPLFRESSRRRTGNKANNFSRRPRLELLEDRRLLATFVVNSIVDPGSGACDAAECTLREAIDTANATLNVVTPDHIEFNIGGAGPHQIQPATALPAITEPVVIDGYTQPGAVPNSNPVGLGLNTVIQIELNGALLFGFENGLHITSGNSTIRGLAVNGFPASGSGIRSQSVGGNVIEGNFIGVDVTGTSAVGNRRGVQVNTANNTIGGNTPEARNLISGSGTSVLISGSSASDNRVQGNLIGTDINGTAPLPGSGGVEIQDAGEDNLIGGRADTEGNVISGNRGSGVFILRTEQTFVQGNLIGTDVNGMTDIENLSYGVQIIQASNNWIGGTTPDERNVISGNGSAGILVNIGSDNVIQGNLVGTDITGNGALGNNMGVRINGSDNTVGGTAVGAGNVISGNTFEGLGLISGSGHNFVQGNFIGTNITGTAALANGGSGVVITSSNNEIGGTDAAARNVISGNVAVGLNIGGPGTGNMVRGNYIGTDITGTVAVPNRTGINLSGSNTIGGSALGEGNLISGNQNAGVVLASNGVVQGNLIGTDVSGNLPLGNGGGVQVGTGGGALSNNLIGGNAPGEGNVISGNRGAGVTVINAAATGIRVEGNSIHSNVGLGIDLANDGVTLNDPGDGDPGANNLQNFPIITSASSSGGNTTIAGSLNSTPNSIFTIEFFSNSTVDSSGFGEGEVFLGTVMLSTDASGNANFTEVISTASPDGHTITATATDPNGNTSEFSAATTVLDPPVIEGIDEGSDLQSLIVQFNDVDLDAVQATNSDNYRVIAANGDANGDGDFFNDGDELELAIDSIVYDSVTDQVTIQIEEAMADEVFRLEIDGDDTTSDGTPGITNLAGSLLAGGDFEIVLDLTCIGLLDRLIMKVEALGLNTGPESSLLAKLDATLHLFGVDSPTNNSLLVKINSFIHGVNLWFGQGDITADQRDALIDIANKIIRCIELN